MKPIVRKDPASGSWVVTFETGDVVDRRSFARWAGAMRFALRRAGKVRILRPCGTTTSLGYPCHLDCATPGEWDAAVRAVAG